ncbi:MAG: adenylate/guanylate cyclase domain-containing protein [Myxococcales bacterium]|nr:MAG: adenylate/guanylate cyclase domain-containing protein [Myxococcales bacterium]
MPAPPSGTVTFLFTDIEGSTKRWENFPDAMARAVECHDRLLREIIEKNGGHVFKTIGDAFCAAFSSPRDGVTTALEAQRAIIGQEWGEVAPIKVRMALHTGVAQERDNDYFGPTVNRVARILGTGHGGQTLLSQLTWQMVQGSEPDGAQFHDFGAHRLKDLAQAEQIFGLLAPGLETEFPPLASLNRQAHNLPVHPTPLIGRDQEVS